jgi:uncharacterized repeat protein (TIGR01451 family)
VNATGDYANFAEVTTSDEDDPTSTPGNGPNNEDDEATETPTPNPVADLSLTKDASDDTPDVGSDVVFTITVANAGPSEATGITVTDQLPSGYTFVTSAGDGSYDEGSGLWTVGSVAGGGSASLDITATVNATGDYANFAEVTTSNADDPTSSPGNGPHNEDDEATETTTPTKVADLSLSKSVDDPTPGVGSDVVFTIGVANAGPSDASGVTVADHFPTGYTFVSSAGDGSYDAGSGLWTVGGLAAGASATLTITANVKPIGGYTNFAQVTFLNEADPDSTPNNGPKGEDDEAEVLTTPIPDPVADLSLSKTVDDPVPDVGSEVVFTILVANAGPVDATRVVVTDQLPSGYSFVASAGDGSYQHISGVWTIGRIASGGSASLTLTASVNPTGDYANFAEVTSLNEADPNSTPGNGPSGEDDEATASTTPNPIADLSLTKSVDEQSPDVGSDVVFTIGIANAGPSNATGVTVEDQLPSGYTFVGSGGDGSYDEATGVWTVGEVAAGGFATLTITATVNDAGEYTNFAETSTANEDDPDSIPGDNSDGDDDDASVEVTPTDRGSVGAAGGPTGAGTGKLLQGSGLGSGCQAKPTQGGQPAWPLIALIAGFAALGWRRRRPIVSLDL